MSTGSSDLEVVRMGIFRAVRSPKRKRKLNRRGDLCQWSHELNAWIWRPQRNITVTKQLPGAEQ